MAIIRNVIIANIIIILRLFFNGLIYHNNCKKGLRFLKDFYLCNYNTYGTMKKVILIFVTIVLSGLLYAKDNKSTDALLREIDGIIKNRQTYGAEKEARIADLKK